MKTTQHIEKLDSIRHSLAHLLAMAVLKKFPNAQLGIGPVIENGFYYDFKLPAPISNDDLPEFEKSMRELIIKKFNFFGKKVTPLQAKKLFQNQPFKIDLIKEFSKEKKQLTVYATCPPEIRNWKLEIGNCFIDLCRGGHTDTTSEINPDAFKLTHIAGAYWRGDEKNPQLTRIYGIAFRTKEELEKHVWQLEEAKKRDHRVLGERLKLFTFAPEVGPGLPLWLPNGTIIRDEIEQYAKEVEKSLGYKRVATPHIAKEELYRLSGHIPYYADSMFPPMKLDDGNYYLKAMNCPHTHMIYRSEPRSYRDLPLRLAEYGTVYRHELSGTLAGLLRVRGFSQNDAHIYCREDQVEKEFLNVMRLHEFWYRDVFGITDFHMRLSLPAKDKKKYIHLPDGWKKSVEMVRSAMKKSGLPFTEAEGEAAFYGPKVDFQIQSVIGREETASTNQLDFLATERFGLTYTDSDGKQKPVFVIHRAPLGSHERFIAFLIEHYAGAFPLWLAPTQISILPINDSIAQYCEEIKKILESRNIRVIINSATETIGKKIRETEMQKIPFMLIIGEKEKSAETVSVRERGGKDLGAMKLDEFIQKISPDLSPKKIKF
ncbi:MAG: threonine--tRNA ligase [Patescibacteria group bacterium]